MIYAYAKLLQCDQTKPQCNRCVKYGAVCPGYPKEQDVRFRYDTRNSARKPYVVLISKLAGIYLTSNSVPRDSALRSNSKPDYTSTCLNVAVWQPQAKTAAVTCTRARQKRQRSTSSSSTNEETSDSPLTSPINIPWEAAITQYFFDQAMMPVGWYSFLPELYRNAPPESCMALTIHTASLFLASNQFNNLDMLQYARKKYGATLQVLNRNLAHEEKCLEDETFASILLLNVLDGFMGYSSSLSSWHLKGCAQLVKLREARGVRTKRSHDLAHSIVIQTQPWLLRGHTREADPGSLGGEVMNNWLWEVTGHTPAAKLASLSAKVGALRNATAAFLKKTDGQPDVDAKDCLYVISDACKLGVELQKWQVQEEDRWICRTADIPPPDEQTRPTYYADIQVAKVWNYWRVARIMLHELIVSIIEHVESLHPSLQGSLYQLKDQSAQVVVEMLQGIAASVPFHVQKIDSRGHKISRSSQRVVGGSALIWPLQTMLECRWALPKQRRLALETLHDVGEVFGVKQAQVCLQQFESDAAKL